MLSRRQFARLAIAGLALPAERTQSGRFLFAARGLTGFMNTDGKTGVMNVDGTGLRYLDVDYRSQFLWQPGPLFSDRRRIILTSMDRGDWGGRSFSDYYHKIRTHLWIYDLPYKAPVAVGSGGRPAGATSQRHPDPKERLHERPPRHPSRTGHAPRTGVGPVR